MTSLPVTNFSQTGLVRLAVLWPPLIYSRTDEGQRAGRGGCLDHVPPCQWAPHPPPLPPVERNCVIMQQALSHSNAHHCLCKRAALLCATEQPRLYTWQRKSTAGQGRPQRGEGGNVCARFRPADTIRLLIGRNRQHKQSRELLEHHWSK